MIESFVNVMPVFLPYFCVGLMLLSLVVFWRAWHLCQSGCFYRDTPGAFWLGIYVWGDALILAPFWFISAGLFLVFPPLFTIRYLLLFFAVRAGYEVIYWLNHQAVKDTYRPPLFRGIKWLQVNEAAILYQLINFCLVVFFASLLLASWSMI